MKQRFTPCYIFSLSKFAFFCFLVGAGLLSAQKVAAQEGCSLIPISLEDRMKTAALVVEGKVISQRSFWDQGQKNIYTSSQVEVYKVFKGQAQTEILEIITEGGQVGLTKHVYSSTLQLEGQDQGVLFLKPIAKNNPKTAYQVFGSLQGFIEYNATTGTAKDPFRKYASIVQEVYPVLEKLTGSTYKALRVNPAVEALSKPKTSSQNNRRAIPLIVSFSPTSLRAGTEDVLTINGTNFGSTRGNGYVEFPDADDGGKSFVQPLPTDYVSWSDTQIRVKVPTNGKENGTAGTGAFRVVNNDPNTATSALPLNIIFAISNISYKDDARNIPEQSYQPRLINQNGQGGYTFRFGASFENNKAALFAFKRSMNEWSCKTLVNWNTAANAAVTSTADDGINSVRFASAGELPFNVLGRCISRYSGCISGTVVNWWVDEMDLEFAVRSDWQYGPAFATRDQFDFESVTLHELGHGHQLSHLILPGAVMHYAVARGQVSKTLNPANDVAGGLYMMARSVGQGICNQPPMVAKSADQCAIPIELLVLTGEYRAADNTVLLKWTTEGETSLKEYVIERSADGVNFTPIGTVQGTGSPSTARSYEFVDPNPLPVLGYYRLRQVRNNGSSDFSDVIEIRGPGFTVLLSPNPGGKTTYLYYNAAVAENLELEVFNTNGQKLKQFKVLVEPGVSRYEITLPAAGSGLFLIRYTGRQQSGVFRYVKLTGF